MYSPVRAAISLFYLSGLANESIFVKTDSGTMEKKPSTCIPSVFNKYSSASSMFWGEPFVVERSWEPSEEDVKDGLRFVALLDYMRMARNFMKVPHYETEETEEEAEKTEVMDSTKEVMDSAAEMNLRVTEEIQEEVIVSDEKKKNSVDMNAEVENETVM